LGPTSDDNTRFAISDSSQLALELDQASWKHVQNRLKKFGLKLTESNQQQAMFPKTATIWTNEFGTANACHLNWQGRDIFMLPGPLKEFLPLLEQKVMPYLRQTHYFNNKKVYRYLTLGLIEGEISSQVDIIAEKFKLSTAYRWHYPYLEIKLIADQENDVVQAINEIETLLCTYIVSTDGTDAESNLNKNLNTFNQPILVKTSLLTRTILDKFKFKNLVFVDHAHQEISANYVMQFDVLWPTEENYSKKIVQFNVCATEQDKLIFQHQLQTPQREIDIDLYVQAYFAWQLSLFIHLINTTG
jgi:molybdopterin-biosynthesis enzyme MoeA-like protein